jgi:hypothetical protein
MQNALGKITATPPTAATPTTTPATPAATPGGAAPTAGGAATPTDTSLPDPTKVAKWALVAMLLVAAAVAVIWNNVFHAGVPFDPAKEGAANFALFAGFYVAAQIIERLLELISPELPVWNVPEPPDPTKTATAEQKATAKAAQVKADRAFAAQGLATVLGVVASCAFGLFFLNAMGIAASHTVDSAATGLLIGAGTKPLHDLITTIQNTNTPATGTNAGTST